MAPSGPDLIVLHEHPEWQKPLFAALERRRLSFLAFDVTRAAFSNVELPRARLYFNQASPSAYIRGHTRAVPLALAYMRSLALDGARVLNGADVFALELSKSAQATLLRTLGIDCPHSITFNDVGALHAHAHEVGWPALLKPDQGGSGARIQVVESMQQVEEIFRDPSVWLPDNLFLLQEYLAHDPEQGIVRMEFLGGELLYAMRVKTHGRFNLCPSPVCNPEEGDGVCAVPAHQATEAPPVEFSPSRDVYGPAGLLRHQRQLEPAPVGGRGVWLRPVRARRRLPRASAGCVAGVSGSPRPHHTEIRTWRADTPMPPTRRSRCRSRGAQ